MRSVAPGDLAMQCGFEVRMGESWASSKGVRNSMRSNRGRDTSSELAVRKILHARGLRYRVNHRLAPPLRATADIVFTRQRVAVFIDGCFWHSCPVHATRPKTNSEYWATKLARNIERDGETTAALETCGWTVLRFWEHESPDEVARHIAQAVLGAPQPARSDHSL